MYNNFSYEWFYATDLTEYWPYSKINYHQFYYFFFQVTFYHHFIVFIWFTWFSICTSQIYPYPSGFLNGTGAINIAPVPVRQPWRIWVNKSHNSTDIITITKRNTTKTYSYVREYPVFDHIICSFFQMLNEDLIPPRERQGLLARSDSSDEDDYIINWLWHHMYCGKFVLMELPQYSYFSRR